MIKQNSNIHNNLCSVTFYLPKEAVEAASEVCLVGDFNAWDLETPIQMKKTNDGAFQIKLKLERGRDYHFRYLIDNIRWENDWYADRYELSPIFKGIENLVVCLTDKLDQSRSFGKRGLP